MTPATVTALTGGTPTNRPGGQQRAAAMSITKAAVRLDVSRSTAYELVASGALRTVLVGSRQKVTEAEIERYLAANEL